MDNPEHINTTGDTGDTIADGSTSTGDKGALSDLVPSANDDGNRNGNGDGNRNDNGDGNRNSNGDGNRNVNGDGNRNGNGDGSGNSNGKRNDSDDIGGGNGIDKGDDNGSGNGNGAGSGNLGDISDDFGTNTTATNDPKSEGDGRQRPEAKYQERHILVFGKPGSGKATIANHICGEDIFEVSHSIEGFTPTEKNRDKMWTNAQKTKCYHIKLVDTIGPSDKRLDQTILDAIRNFLAISPNGIHLILFVVKNVRFTREDRDPIIAVLQIVGEQIAPISAMVMTCCEGMDESARDELREDFRTGQSTVSIARFMQKGVYSVGFPNQANVRVELKEIYESSMKEDEKLLRQLVAECRFTKLSQDEFRKIRSRMRPVGCRPQWQDNSCVIA